MNWHKELETWFDRHADEGTALLCDVVRQNTVNPPGDEYRATEVVAKYLSQYAIASETHEGAAGRTNLLARVGTGAPVLFVPAHTDVVPVGEGWDHDPFDPLIRDGYIYGRGVSDDKGPLASLLLLAAFLKEHEAAFRGTLLAGAVADEERGSTHGIVYLLQHNLVHADYAIVPDTGSSIYQVSCGEKGLLHVEVTFHGAQAHGSTPEKGCNAVWAAWEFLRALRAEFGEQPGYCHGAQHELFSPTTINLARVHGGGAFNIIPAQCAVRLDIRYIPGQTRDELLARINAYAQSVVDKHLCHSFEVTVDSHMAPYVLDERNPVVAAVRKAVHIVSGREVQRMGMSGTTVCKQLVENNIPAVGWSQAAHDQAHMANERLAVSEIKTFGVALGLAFLALGDNL